MKSESYNGTRIDFYDGWVEVTVPGYPTFSAVPEDTPEYRARALSLGFVDEFGVVAQCLMNYEHDRAHAFLAKRLGLRVSPALHGVAAKLPPNAVTDAEEQFVLAYHRYKNALIRAHLWRRPL